MRQKFSSQLGSAPVIVVLLIIIAGLSGYLIVKEVSPTLKNSQLARKEESVQTPTPSTQPSPTPTPTPTPRPTAVPTPTPTPIPPTPTPTPSCTVVKTYGMFDNNPEFEAEKCYTYSDARALDDAIRKLNNAIFNYTGAANQANVTCQGFTESFKQMCEQSKQDADKYKAEIDKYKAEIHAIMARGK